VRPAAGPLTLVCEPLIRPTTIPPMIPDIRPDRRGAPDANAIPRHSGRATKKTTMDDGRSFFILEIIVCSFKRVRIGKRRSQGAIKEKYRHVIQHCIQSIYGSMRIDKKA
jgi:hypothetical protein